MITEPGTRPGRVGEAAVAYSGAAFVEAPQCGRRQVEVELLGGRDRWSVGGQIAEGPRWWRGEITWDGDVDGLDAGTRVTVALDNGRSAQAVVEPSPAPRRVTVRGIEPPPFAVP